MTLDLHAGQIQGFFDIPTDNLFASPVMVRDIKERFDLANVMVVSPDVGGVVRARGLAKRINTPLAIIDKRRERAGESEVMNVIGDCAGYTCILIDDIVDSGGTLVNAADALLANGAKEVYAYITPRRAVRRRRRPHRRLQAEGARHHRLDPADRSGQQGAQHPHAVDRRPDRAKPSAAPRRKSRCRACSTEGRYSFNVIASEAKQSSFPSCCAMDCFASLAMTASHSFAISPRISPEVCLYRSALSESEGAGNAGRPMRP